MKFSVEERLKIGKEIYDKRISIYDAAKIYNINIYTARDYMRQYRSYNNLPSRNDSNDNNFNIVVDYDELNLLSKDELIKELIKARIEANQVKNALKEIFKLTLNNKD